MRPNALELGFRKVDMAYDHPPEAGGPTMNRLTLIALPLAMLALSACDGSSRTNGDAASKGGSPTTAAGPVRTQADERLPAGFTLINGGGGIRDLSVEDAQGDGKIVAYATIVPPRDAVAHYEREAVAAGMTVIARMDAGEIRAVNARRTGGAAPHTISATASQKGEFTNITLMFDIGV